MRDSRVKLRLLRDKYKCTASGLCPVGSFFFFVCRSETRQDTMPDYRKNSMIIDFSVVPTRPTISDIHKFVFESLQITMASIKSIQLSSAKSYVYLEMESAALAEQLVAENNRKFSIKTDGGEYEIPMYVADGGVEVKICDLPPHMPNNIIAKHLAAFGEVISIKDDVWREYFPGLPNGNRTVRMRIQKAIPSYLSMENETAYIRYRNQVPTCRYCSRNLHVGSKCSDVRKALAKSVNERLSLASIVQGLNPILTESTNTSNTSSQGGQSSTVPVSGGTQHGSSTSDVIAADTMVVESEVTVDVSKTDQHSSTATLEPFDISDSETEDNNEMGIRERQHTINSTDRSTDSVAGCMESDETMDDQQDSWREVRSKRSVSPRLAETSKIKAKRQSRSKNRSK